MFHSYPSRTNRPTSSRRNIHWRRTRGHRSRVQHLLDICRVHFVARDMRNIHRTTSCLNNNYEGFEVFTAVTMKNAVFWDMASCRSCVNRRFWGAYRLHLQGRKIRERGISVCCHLLTLVPRSRNFLPWRWRRYVPPKRWFTQELHGATSQKTAFFNTYEHYRSKSML
jgi:hypothetical protein